MQALSSRLRSRALALVLAVCAAVLLSTGAIAQVVDRSSMTNKVMCGYQGWQTCPGDGNDAGVDWYHWANDRSWIGPGNYHPEVWPDTAEYSGSDLFQVPNTTLTQGGTPYLYSASKQGAVNTHFRWMQEYGIDGVWLQRFLIDLSDSRFFNMRATVTTNVKNAASSYGRVWAMEWDISGVPENELYNRITSDWQYLKSTFGITSDSRYLRHNNKPVVAVWGLGFTDRPGTPAIATSIINYLKNDGCFVVGGVPWGWRDRSGGSKTDPAWDAVYRSFDCITPWTVGAYTDWNGINSYKTGRATADLSTCNSLGIIYMPTLWPRFGWDNMNGTPCGSSHISTRGGQHLWDQFYAYKSIGVSTQWLAMFDEYDEGTAIAKLTDNVPTSGCWFNTEGKGKDWWLRLAGQGSRMQRGEISLSQTIPINSANSPDNATMVSDTIPTSMNPSQTYNVSVTVQNTGETAWNDGNWFKLGAVGDSDPFGPGRVNIGSVVMPGSNYTFNFTMTAPSQNGTYTSDWQMVHEGIRWFGAQLVKVITVGGGGGGTDNSQYIADTIPTTMNPGQVTNVSVTMKNTGTSTWSEAALYRLGAMGDSDPFYGSTRVLLTGSETIAPQAQKQFNFTMTAPTTPGTYTTDWQMVHDGVAWFGGTLVKPVVVKNMVSIDLGTTNVQNGMTCPTGGDGDNYAVTQGSVDCRRNTSSSDDYYFYFTISDSWAYQGNKPDVYIRVRYYDTGGGDIAVQYDSSSNPYTSTSAVAVGSTNTWKYATWHVTNAYFGNRQNGGTDLRLWLNTGKIRYIDTVEVSTTAF